MTGLVPIIWGRRVKKAHLGYVADFCATCRVVNRFRLFHLTELRHVYFFFTLPGEGECYEIECQECGTVYTTDPSAYSHYASDAASDPVALAEETQPLLYARYARSLCLEERLRAGEASEQERRALLMQPLLAYEAEIRLRPHSRGIPQRLIWIVLAVGLLWLFVGVAAYVVPAWRTALTDLGLIATAGAALVWAYRQATATRRLIRGSLLPKIGRALQPLQPAHDELVALISHLQSRAHLIARSITVEDLAASMMAPASTGRPAHADRVPFDELLLTEHWLARAWPSADDRVGE